MALGFKHKELEAFYNTDATKRIQSAHTLKAKT
ncbi:Uncharacterised protein [Candidatus Bartonella washoeensis]|uniref:Uncharacterized protein n=1 Tax=Candidatus Bartonella washoeensis Sb944nv TaxID=1094563 RepID=J0YXD9_9HYPH|nr:hypothetical protein MCQ_00590 [Bartonella washoeensis Sb944nv]EJF80272.1 hypothetical protein MCQ_00508 [Bartonella washoeensis Sb944nv]SPU26890.1 Uncharacterised protein [Bartonella washoeensis]